MSSEKFGFEELEFWKKVRAFKNDIRKLTLQFSPEEKFRLTDQLIRSSRSIDSLITEGHGRFTYPDQIHYCIQSRGSLSETINHLFDAFDESYITDIILAGFKKQGKEIERMLNGYIIYLRKKREDPK